jgi:hypothetical protein
MPCGRGYSCCQSPTECGASGRVATSAVRRPPWTTTASCWSMRARPWMPHRYSTALTCSADTGRCLGAILLPHWHNDQAAGAVRIKALSGARVYYRGRERPYLMRETARRLAWMAVQAGARARTARLGPWSAERCHSDGGAGGCAGLRRRLVLGRFRVVAQIPGSEWPLLGKFAP